ncbi:hypothetical protein C8J56DRAFT_787775, partial [Mycena floridula]
DDIDTTLVFISLYYLTIRKFLTESYKWLSLEPADTTVHLFFQIAIQLGTTNAYAREPNPIHTFPSLHHINIFRFLSLTSDCPDCYSGERMAP